mmetsp:Transcript_4521/g.10526  ORF Transcript_4521/g.10526 Transcript_4521/m.10526 type:complete len:200 (+) Transcript_4521:771-1370(+)
MTLAEELSLLRDSVASPRTGARSCLELFAQGCHLRSEVLDDALIQLVRQLPRRLLGVSKSSSSRFTLGRQRLELPPQPSGHVNEVGLWNKGTPGLCDLEALLDLPQLLLQVRSASLGFCSSSLLELQAGGERVTFEDQSRERGEGVGISPDPPRRGLELLPFQLFAPLLQSTEPLPKLPLLRVPLIDVRRGHIQTGPTP